MAQNSAAKSHAKATAAAQNCTATGRHIPQPTLPKNDPNVTEVVVIRNGGHEDLEAEDALRQRPAGDIVREVQSALERSTRTPLKILKGAWSTSSHYTGNFIYTLVGDLPLAHITSFKKWLCGPFKGGDLVTTRGWTWAQIWGVLLKDDDGVIWEPEVLERELWCNPMFTDATLSCSPHWLQDPHTLRGENSTVLVAYEDRDNRRTQEAVSKGIAMFGYQVQFVFVGDTPTRVQCGRCWQLGHRDGWVECKVPTTQVLCLRCGAAHHTRDHDYECPQEHRVAGKCDCRLPCLLCHKLGHNARSCHCPKRGDHPPPPYARTWEEGTRGPRKSGPRCRGPPSTGTPPRIAPRKAGPAKVILPRAHPVDSTPPHPAQTKPPPPMQAIRPPSPSPPLGLDPDLVAVFRASAKNGP